MPACLAAPMSKVIVWAQPALAAVQPISLTALADCFGSSCMMYCARTSVATADQPALALLRAMAAFMVAIETIFLAGPNIPLSSVTSRLAATNS